MRALLKMATHLLAATAFLALMVVNVDVGIQGNSLSDMGSIITGPETAYAGFCKRNGCIGGDDDCAAKRVTIWFITIEKWCKTTVESNEEENK